MTEKRRRSWLEMAAIAGQLVRELSPACQRILVAGSLRRGRPQVGDIEIVAISDGDTLLDATDAWLASREVSKRLKSNNTPIAWGARFRAMVWRGVSVDLFITTPEQWGLISVIRTGPGTPDVGFEQWRGGANQMLVTPRAKGGLLPDEMRVADGWLWRGERRLRTPEDSDVFRLIGLPLIAPPLRSCAEYMRWKSAGQNGIERLRERHHPALSYATRWPAVGWGGYNPDVIFQPARDGFLPWSMAALINMAERGA